MELRIEPSNSNYYPLSGFFMANSSVAYWVQELQAIGLTLQQVAVYPLPGQQANSIWGCYVEMHSEKPPKLIGLHSFAQAVEDLLIIPEQSQLFPKLSLQELQQLFKSGKTVYHPAIGFYQLEKALNWSDLVQPPQESEAILRIPEDPVFIPSRVRSFRVKPVALEESLKDLEKVLYPDKDALSDQPLTALEKAKLSLYKLLKGKEGSDSGSASSGGFGSVLGGILDGLGTLGQKWQQRMEQDMENLEERNKGNLEKLLEMLEKNPEEGLKYSIPLDEGGSSRGDGNAPLWLSKMWESLSLFDGISSAGAGGSTGGGSVNLGDDYFKLREKYEQTATALIAEGKYEKAAFVYFKLLKNLPKAAETLKQGKLYAEAAAFYLKHLKNKEAAALCYEEGNMFDEAILLYQELENYEKAGDLCMKVNRREQAMRNYTQLAHAYLGNDQYVKAALVYKYKMQQPEACQEFLLEGWQAQKDSVNCLKTYFSNVEDGDAFEKTLQNLYEQEVDADNRMMFLEVLKSQFPKRATSQPMVRNLAYEIVAKQALADPSVVSSLSFFNHENAAFHKDVVRFKLYQRKNNK